MGLFDGAETCELVGLYLLSQLPKNIREKVELYRDDGLGAFKESPRQIEQIKKQICKIFSNNNLKITIEANKKVINFLDVTLDLNKGTYKPFIKPNNTPLYVHRESNHPPSIIRNIPAAINKRLNKTSSNKEDFDKAAPIYQQALNNSGYDFKVEFERAGKKTPIREEKTPQEKKMRCRNITWFNPPLQQSCKDQCGQKVLKYCERVFQNRPSIEKDLQQEHFETQLFMHAQPRKENRHPQQVTITKAYTNTRKAMQLPITTQLPAEWEMPNH